MQKPPANPDLSIIIVSWNVREYLAACLDSIQAAMMAHPERPRIEVIVVESGSTDGSPDMLRERFDTPWVRVLAQAENIGFTRGNNIGLAAARGRLLMLLNPDTEVTPGALAELAAYLETHPDVGIVGPHTLNTDGTPQSTRRRFPTLVTAFFESTWLQPLAPRRVLDRYYVRDVADTGTADVDWVQGSALMLRREVYAQIGGLDEQYVMYSEELDWCKRARRSGWRVVYVGTATITHHGGKSSDQVTVARHVYFQQSKLRYFARFHGKFAALVLRLFMILMYAWQIAIESAKGIIGLKRVMRRERVRVYWQVIRALAGVA